MAGTFTWTPDQGPQAPHRPRGFSVSFGDGYVQDTGDGLNIDLPEWSVAFTNRSTAEFDAIKAFLGGLAYGERFTWTPPRGSAGLYKCTEWDETPYTNGITTHTITAKFKKVVA
ncbi:phage tail protein [Mesoterricola sediminis]|uniref:Phage-related protein n=1 Tax=Mesoterricola sediminis TaxID=2927980 RepID=A0AA48H2J9_9BACT|nr:phage tail protein [Mesoterricola sediminis]BDU76306.1 hypothetical protein METESE_12640 [Mesoterricola sediminis]